MGICASEPVDNWTVYNTKSSNNLSGDEDPVQAEELWGTSLEVAGNEGSDSSWVPKTFALCADGYKERHFPRDTFWFILEGGMTINVVSGADLKAQTGDVIFFPQGSTITKATVPKGGMRAWECSAQGVDLDRPLVSEGDSDKFVDGAPQDTSAELQDAMHIELFRDFMGKPLEKMCRTEDELNADAHMSAPVVRGREGATLCISAWTLSDGNPLSFEVEYGEYRYIQAGTMHVEDYTTRDKVEIETGDVVHLPVGKQIEISTDGFVKGFLCVEQQQYVHAQCAA